MRATARAQPPHVHADGLTRTRLAALERLAEAVIVTGPDGSAAYANKAARDLAARLGISAPPHGAPSLEGAALHCDGSALEEGRRPSESTRLTGRTCERMAIAVPTADGALWRLEVTTRAMSGDRPPYPVVATYRPLDAHEALEARGAADPAAAADGSNAHQPGDLDAERRALRQARELFSAAFQHAPIGMAIVDPAGRWLLVNRALCDLVGHSETELLDRSFHDITHPEDLPGQLALMRELLDGKRSSYQLDKRYLHADGHVIWASISVSMVRDERGAPLHLVAQIVDITERYESDRRLQHLADHDPLTGVLNRRRFEEELIRQLDRCRRYDEHATLVMIDLDFFKDVNDSLGHAAGDETLQAIAAGLLGHVRSSDILARVGGDEFAALLVGVGPDQAPRAAAGLAAVIRGLDGLPAPVTASVGATVLERDDHADSALQRADEAFYRVKREGRDGSAVAPSPRSSPSR